VKRIAPDTLGMIYGFTLLLVLAGLAGAIALGDVQEKTSHGLMPIVTSLATLAGQFGQWAFGKGRKTGKLQEGTDEHLD